MIQHNSVNINLADSQVNRLKPTTKNSTEVTLGFLSNMIGHAYDATNFPHKLLQTNREVRIFRKAFANDLSVNLELTKTEKSKMIQSSGFFDSFLRPLMKVASQ